MIKLFGGIYKIFLWFGVLMLVIAGFLYIIEKFNWKGLPGDIIIKGENYTIFIPIVSSILISILLSFLLTIIVWILGRVR